MINVQVNIFQGKLFDYYDFLGYDINNIFYQKSVRENSNEVLLSFIDTYQCIFHFLLKFIYSEKATKFCEISTLDLSYDSYVVTVKSTVHILQNFVVFSEYMNFKLGKCTFLAGNSNFLKYWLLNEIYL